MFALGGCDLAKKVADRGNGSSLDAKTPSGLLSDVSGVWRTDGNELVTIDAGGSHLQLLVDDAFIPVQLGDMDEENQTVNLKIRLADGRDGIWTLRKIDESAKAESFHLGLTTHEGKATELSFVRKIGTDDLNRIAALGSRQASQASILGEIVGNAQAPPQEAVDPAQTAADAAAAAADTAMAAAEVAEEAGPQPASGPADGAASSPSTPSIRSLTDNNGIVYLIEANADGLALKSDNATIFIGVSCDAFSPQYGKASWEWRAGRLTVDFGNRQVAFETPAPKFTDGKCMG